MSALAIVGCAGFLAYTIAGFTIMAWLMPRLSPESEDEE